MAHKHDVESIYFCFVFVKEIRKIPPSKKKKKKEKLEQFALNVLNDLYVLVHLPALARARAAALCIT